MVFPESSSNRQRDCSSIVLSALHNQPKISDSPTAISAGSADGWSISRGKLQRAAGPRIDRAALSYARAASSAVSNVPSHLDKGIYK